MLSFFVEKEIENITVKENPTQTISPEWALLTLDIIIMKVS